MSNADKRMRNKMMKAASRYWQDITNQNESLRDTRRMSFILESIGKGAYIGSDEF